MAEKNVVTDNAMPETQGTQEVPMSRVEMEKKIREEAKRLRITEHLLSAPHLQRVQDTLRLNETKLANIEENLLRTREQKDRLRRFKELQGEIEIQRIHLQEINKQAASMLGDKKELERFETFENIQGRFQRLQILESQRHEAKTIESRLVSDIERMNREMEDEKKRFNQCQDEANESENNLAQGQAAITNATRIEGGNTALEYALQKIREHRAELISTLNALEKELQEHEQETDALKKDIEKKLTRLQSTDTHQSMTEHCEILVDQLGRLHEMKEKQANIDIRMKEAERKQRSANDLLTRAFSDFQQIEAQIKTTSDELHVHRQNIHGQDSYQLQERAMNLKRRRQMLKSALALWKRIHHLYSLIETKQQEINSLRLHQEHAADNAAQMEAELGILRRSAKEKEYAFTLSKSQNVIQLRGDLKEGVNCTVCGATHHPYHSDTMLEQNKLIGELKTEAELLRTELQNKEKEYMETCLDLKQAITAKKAAEDELVTLRSLQNEAVKDWSMFSELDHSFRSCDSSTNAEARTAMLCHLIENIEADVRKAQEELDTYNFHQKRINELAETMGRLEQTRGDLATRMNEINTSCQVLARELEWISALRQELNNSFEQLFEVIDKHISIPDWQNTWRQNPENTIMRIQELTNERKQLTASLKETEQQLLMTDTIREQTRIRQQELNSELTAIQNAIDKYEKLTEENSKELERLLHGMKAKQYNDQLISQYQECSKKLEQQRLTTDSKKETYIQAQGKLENLLYISTQTDEMTARERSALDIWMRQYNASHSPVQYSELAQFFQQNRDWTQIRENIRSIDMESKLTQAKLDQLRGQMVALQAEGNIPDGDATDALLALAKQEEVLEKRRKDTMLLIATNTLTLQAHEKAENQIKGEKMKEPGKEEAF